MGFKPRVDSSTFSLVATDLDVEAEQKWLQEISAERDMLANPEPNLIDLAADRIASGGKWFLALPARAGRWLVGLPGRALAWVKGLWQDFWGW